MKTLVSFQYPLHHAAEFYPLNDFEVMKGILLDEEATVFFQNLYAHTVLDATGMALPGIKYLEQRLMLHGLIAPTGNDPDDNIIEATKWYQYCGEQAIKPYVVWFGEKRHVKYLQRLDNAIICFPNWEIRSIHMQPEYIPRYHFYELQNLDELRRCKPLSLHTAIPVQAAMIGISLRNRERRPKHLPAFDYKTILTTQQLELALDNCAAVKEALNEGCNPQPHP